MVLTQKHIRAIIIFLLKWMFTAYGETLQSSFQVFNTQAVKFIRYD